MLKTAGLILPIIILAICLGLFIGAMPWFLTLGLIFLISALALLGRSAIVDVSILLLIALGIVPIPGRSKGDLLAMVLMLFVILRSAGSIGTVIRKHKQILCYVGVVVILVAVSTIYGAVVKRNDPSLVYGDARFILYWLAFPTFLVLLEDRMTVRRLAGTLASFGAVLGAVGVLQAALGRRLLLAEGGRVEALQNTLSTYQDVTRSIVPGTVLMTFVCFLSLSRLLSSDKSVKRLWWWVALLLSAAGTVVNYGRALWLATIVLSLVIAYRSRNPQRLVRVVALLSLVGVAAVGAVYVAKPTILESIVDRVVSSKEEGRSSTSLSWRQFENSYAIKSIMNRPILGVGMGGEYKPFQSGLGVAVDDLQTVYIHNSYLFILLKAGILSGLAFLAIHAYLAIRLNRTPDGGSSDDFVRGVIYAGGALGVQIMAMAIIEPEFNAFSGVLMFAIALAMTEHLRVTRAQGTGKKDVSATVANGRTRQYASLPTSTKMAD